VSAQPIDQATQLRELMQAGMRDRLAARSSRAHVIAIASGKGGVGKTNVAVNLSIALARKGLRVVLVDADLGTANVDVVMNVQAPYDLSHVLRKQRTLDEVIVRAESGLRLVVGASGLPAAADLSPFDRQELIEQLAPLESQSDFLILDCGAGISQNVLAFAQASDDLLVVTTPEPTALTDAYALIKVLSRTASCPRLGLVVNQAASAREALLISERVSTVAARFLGADLLPAGQILRDPHVGLAVRQRIPFVVKYPQCPAAHGISALAERVANPALRPAGGHGFFRRVFGFFY
jgi:flagellar biosynthesis protein FlhG